MLKYCCKEETFYMSRYILLNKDTPVINLSFSEIPGQTIHVSEINEVYNLPFAPPAILKEKRDLASMLDEWWYNRWRVAYKRNIFFKNPITKNWSEADFHKLVLQGHALSLADQYWLCPEKSSATWSKVNFYTNSFSQEFVKSLLDKNFVPSKNSNFVTPDNTTGGTNPKCWISEPTGPSLLKFGLQPHGQIVINEYIAHRVLSHLNIEHLPYEKIKINGQFAAKAPPLVDNEHEFVSLAALINEFSIENIIDAIKTHCPHLLDNFIQRMNQVFVVWFILHSNEIPDMDYGIDFGVIRNVESLQYEKIAPMFDNENCLYIVRPIHHRAEQLQNDLRKNIAFYLANSNLKKDKLKDIPDMVTDILRNHETIPSEHAKYILEHLQENVNIILNA